MVFLRLYLCTWKNLNVVEFVWVGQWDTYSYNFVFTCYL
jgi:hypothetical protein